MMDLQEIDDAISNLCIQLQDITEQVLPECTTNESIWKTATVAAGLGHSLAALLTAREKAGDVGKGNLSNAEQGREEKNRTEIKKARLKTSGILKDFDHNAADYPLYENDYQLYEKIYEYMDGETAFVTESGIKEGIYAFLGLEDQEKNRELFYMFEQNSSLGVYIDDREGFDRDWDSGEYELDRCFYLDAENVEIIVGGGCG